MNSEVTKIEMDEYPYWLNFQGYWLEEHQQYVPNESGVYCVYSCEFDSVSNTVNLKDLIYIGNSENVQDRIAKQTQSQNWHEKLSNGDKLCYSFAPVYPLSFSNDQEVASALLLNLIAELPKCNDKIPLLPDDFKANLTTVGANWKLDNYMEFPKQNATNQVAI